MGSPRTQVENILRNWQGEDSGEHSSARQIADLIDREYQQYINSLPQKTTAIDAGNKARELMLR